MSRDIKFRGKRIDNGTWVYGYLIGNDAIVGEIVEWDSEYFNTEFWRKVDPETVGQYTGLKDKNGKEIYEGDVLLEILSPDEKYAHVVVWSQDDCAWMFEYYGDLFTASEMNFEQCEVIGNIYSNPEMLEDNHGSDQ